MRDQLTVSVKSRLPAVRFCGSSGIIFCPGSCDKYMSHGSMVLGEDEIITPRGALGLEPLASGAWCSGEDGPLWSVRVCLVGPGAAESRQGTILVRAGQGRGAGVGGAPCLQRYINTFTVTSPQVCRLEHFKVGSLNIPRTGSLK